MKTGTVKLRLKVNNDRATKMDANRTKNSIVFDVVGMIIVFGEVVHECIVA